MNKVSRKEALVRNMVNEKDGEESHRLDYGRPMGSRDEGHPFEMMIARIPPGKRHTCFHGHTTQWEFYYVLEGSGQMRLLEV